MAMFDIADPLQPRPLVEFALNDGRVWPDIAADERWLWVAEQDCVRLFEVVAGALTELGCHRSEPSYALLPRVVARPHSDLDRITLR